ncbi:MAG: GNAT family N-acetyltransferase [Ardenticatenaceae bacterium]|nr:GNAT family N-acetyltransferase [Ardenticatenaceae bacterium]
MSEWVVERAQMADVAEIVGLFEAAAVWMVGRGLDQWPTRVSARFWHFLRGKVREGEVFVVRGADGRLLGHIRFDYQPNKVWRDNPAHTAYVRGLVIANEVRGQGLGAALLDWAQGYVGEKGYRQMRLDCLAENGRLRQYYADYGFAFLGESRRGDYRAALFELRLAANGRLNRR